MSVLVDTSVWIDYLAGRSAVRQPLDDLLDAGEVAMHEIVLGELAMGNLRQRSGTLARLRQLPHLQVAAAAEVMSLVEARRLCGQGIGWSDAHLIASALIDGDHLWTTDARLAKVAAALGLAHR